MKENKRYKFDDSFSELIPYGNLFATGHDCKYELVGTCFAKDPSVKDCLNCHRALMLDSRRAYLDFYKNVYLPWNNERKDGDVDGERLQSSKKE